MLNDNKQQFKSTISLKNTWINLESIDSGQKYTITLNPLKQPIDNTRKNIYIWHRQQHDELRNLCEITDVELRLFYEQSSNGRSHYHGTLITNDLAKFGQFVHVINQDYSSEMDVVNDSIKWTTYITKQSHIWNYFFEKHTCIHPLHIKPRDVPSPVKKTDMESDDEG